MTRPFRVLTVCTGNICRSPAVERLLAHGLGPGSGVEVTSAGVGAVVGSGVAPLMDERLRALGVDPNGFAARQVTAAMLGEADLVLPLTRAHRSQVVTLAPAVVRRTFTVRELARLGERVGGAALPTGTPADRLAALVSLAAAQRGRAHVDPALDDVIDPWGQADAAYDRSLAELRPAVETIVALARG